MTTAATAAEPPNRTERKRAKKRAEILRMAAAILTERGYSGTSLDEIAERLDIAKSTLYHYFESKDALLTACLKQPSLDAMERLEREAKRHVEPKERLQALIRENLTLVLIAYRDTSRLFMHPFELPEPLKSEYRALRKRHDKLFRWAIQEGIKTGVFDPEDEPAARHNMYGAMNHSALWVRGNPKAVQRQIDALVPSIMRLFSPQRGRP